MSRLLVLLMLGVVACQPRTTELTDERKAEIAAEVNARNAEYWDAWRAADWDRGMAYYVDSPDFVWAAGGVVFYGKERLEQSRPGFANVASQAFLFRDSRTVVMASDAATVIALGTWVQVDTAGVTGPAREFAWTALWVLRDGEWKMHMVHMSYPMRADAM
jgi:ketosteroid isomerase-like protein